MMAPISVKRCFSVLAMTIAAIAACATTEASGTDGESHFVCASDADCEELGENYSCMDQTCIVVTDGSDAGSCPETIEEYCATAQHDQCVSLEEALARVECGEVRWRQGDRVEVRGCGLVGLEIIGGTVGGSSATYYDPLDGRPVGHWESTDVPYCNGEHTLVVGEVPPRGSWAQGSGVGCDDRLVPECSLCGHSTCELTACSEEIARCHEACRVMANCSVALGCSGPECTDPAVCPALELVDVYDAEESLADMEAVLTCMAASGCTDDCPNSVREVLAEADALTPTDDEADAAAPNMPLEITGTQAGQTIAATVTQEIRVTLTTVGPGQYGDPDISAGAIIFDRMEFPAEQVPAGPTQIFYFEAIELGSATITIPHSIGSPFSVTIQVGP